MIFDCSVARQGAGQGLTEASVLISLGTALLGSAGALSMSNALEASTFSVALSLLSFRLYSVSEFRVLFLLIIVFAITWVFQQHWKNGAVRFSPRDAGGERLSGLLLGTLLLPALLLSAACLRLDDGRLAFACGQQACWLRDAACLLLVGSLATLLVLPSVGAVVRRCRAVAGAVSSALMLASLAALASLSARLVTPEVPGWAAAASFAVLLAAAPALLLAFPGTFTVAEAVLVSQLLQLLVLVTPAIPEQPSGELRDVLLVLQAGLLGCVSLLALLYAPMRATRRLAAEAKRRAAAGAGAGYQRKSVVVWAAAVLWMAVAVLPLMHLRLGQFPLTWLIKLIVVRPRRLLLMAYWLVTLLLSIAWSANHRRRRRKLTVERKLWHVVALLLFVPAFVYEVVQRRDLGAAACLGRPVAFHRTPQPLLATCRDTWRACC
eukprot:TRINITY_DN59_c2_g1_i3.p1 TRINITY_DN59_c2_g1~~TRINITY_DN59_c2_g1_i3.p1  ORF type:complete len:436 (+),score=98.08 TRINITY_DN59_c2_g1_i3:478-1785(+)